MAESRRLHPASPVFSILRHARSLLIPGLLVLLVGGNSWQLWLMVLFVPSAVFEVVRCAVFRYRLTEDTLVTTLAFVGRTERVLRYERIQNIESVQGVLHRMLGVCEIRIETGAGGKPEAVLRVVPAGEVSRIRERVFSERRAHQSAPEPGGGVGSGAGSAAEEGVELLRLGGLDFVRLGLITMRGMVLLALAFGVAWELDLFDRFDTIRGWLLGWLRSAGPHATELTVGLAAGAAILAAAGGLVAASIAWAVLRFGGFRLTRVGEDFRIEAGLLTRVHATVPRQRVQLVRLTEGFQHRRFERGAISVETAGGVDPSSHQESSFGRRWFAPLVRPEAVAEIAGAVRPGLSLDAEDWSRLSERALRRRLRKSVLMGSVLAIAVGAATVSVFGLWGVGVGPALGGWVVLAGRRAASLARYRRTTEWIGCRVGVLTRHTSVAFLDRAQVIEITESPFDRRAGMATLRIDTAGGLTAVPRVDLPMLDVADARGHARAVAQAAERGGFVW